MTTEDQLKAEFEALFNSQLKEAKKQVVINKNPNPIKGRRLPIIKKYTIIDVTPDGYGN